MRGRWIDTRKVGDMIIRSGRVIAAALVVALAACSSTPGQSESSPPVGSTVAPPSSTTSTMSAAPFPVATFAAISEEPVTDELAAKFQVALDDLVGSAGFGEGGGSGALDVRRVRLMTVGRLEGLRGRGVAAPG
jgi:hypothetical protein